MALTIPTDPEWQWVYNGILYTSGEQWPQANEDDLRALANDLVNLAADIHNAGVGVGDLSAGALNSWDGTTSQHFYESAGKIADRLPDIVGSAGQMSGDVSAFALDTEQTKLTIIIAMITMAIEIFLAIVAGFGYMAPSMIKIGGSIVRAIIRAFRARRLAQTGRHVPDAVKEVVKKVPKKRGLGYHVREGAEEIVEGAVEEGAENLGAQGIQIFQGNRKHVDGKGVAIDIAFGAAVGAASSVAHGAAHRVSPDFAKSAGGQGIIGFAGEAPVEAIGSAIMGGGFNPLATLSSSMFSSAATKWAHDAGHAIGASQNPAPGDPGSSHGLDHEAFVATPAGDGLSPSPAGGTPASPAGAPTNAPSTSTGTGSGGSSRVGSGGGRTGSGSSSGSSGNVGGAGGAGTNGGSGSSPSGSPAGGRGGTGGTNAGAAGTAGTNGSTVGASTSGSNSSSASGSAGSGTGGPGTAGRDESTVDGEPGSAVGPTGLPGFATGSAPAGFTPAAAPASIASTPTAPPTSSGTAGASTASPSTSSTPASSSSTAGSATASTTTPAASRGAGPATSASAGFGGSTATGPSGVPAPPASGAARPTAPPAASAANAGAAAAPTDAPPLPGRTPPAAPSSDADPMSGGRTAPVPAPRNAPAEYEARKPGASEPGPSRSGRTDRGEGGRAGRSEAGRRKRRDETGGQERSAESDYTARSWAYLNATLPEQFSRNLSGPVELHLEDGVRNMINAVDSWVDVVADTPQGQDRLIRLMAATVSAEAEVRGRPEMADRFDEDHFRAMLGTAPSPAPAPVEPPPAARSNRPAPPARERRPLPEPPRPAQPVRERKPLPEPPRPAQPDLNPISMAERQVPDDGNCLFHAFLLSAREQRVDLPAGMPTLAPGDPAGHMSPMLQLRRIAAARLESRHLPAEVDRWQLLSLVLREGDYQSLNLARKVTGAYLEAHQDDLRDRLQAAQNHVDADPRRRGGPVLDLTRANFNMALRLLDGDDHITVLRDMIATPGAWNSVLGDDVPFVLASIFDLDLRVDDVASRRHGVSATAHHTLGRQQLFVRRHGRNHYAALAPNTPQRVTGSYTEHFLFREVNQLLDQAKLPRATIAEVDAAFAESLDPASDNHRMVAWRVAYDIAAKREPGTTPQFPRRPRLRGAGAGIEIEIPVHVRPAPGETFPEGVGRHRLFRDNLAGIDAVTDESVLWSNASGSKVYTDPAKAPPGEDLEKKVVHVVELTTDKLRVHEGEPGRAAETSLRALRAYAAKLESSTELTPLRGKLDQIAVDMGEDGRDAVVAGPADIGRVPGSGRYLTQVSIGITPQGLLDAIRYAQHIAPPNTGRGDLPIEHSQDAAEFGSRLALSYLGIDTPTAVPAAAASAFLPHSAEVSALIGTAATAYMQWAANIHRTEVNVKNNTLLILRTNLDALHRALPEPVRRFLRDNADRIGRQAVERILQRAGMNDTVEAVNGRELFPRGDRFVIRDWLYAYLNPDLVPAGADGTPARISARHFGVHTTFDELDDGLAVLEFRKIGYRTLDRAEKAYDNVTTVARNAERKATARISWYGGNAGAEHDAAIRRGLAVLTSGETAARIVRQLILRVPPAILESYTGEIDEQPRNLVGQLLIGADAWLRHGSAGAWEFRDAIAAVRTLLGEPSQDNPHQALVVLAARAERDLDQAGAGQDRVRRRQQARAHPYRRPQQAAGRPRAGAATLPAADGPAWLAAVNPGRAEAGDFLTNCVLAAIGTDMTLEARGTQRFQVPPSGPMDLTDLLNYANDPARGAAARPAGFVRTSAGDVRRALATAPLWDRGIVAVPGDPGHVVNAVRLDSGPALLDGQLGRNADIPDDTTVWFLPLTDGVTVDGTPVPDAELAARKAGAAGSETAGPVMGRAGGDAVPTHVHLIWIGSGRLSASARENLLGWARTAHAAGWTAMLWTDQASRRANNLFLRMDFATAGGTVRDVDILFDDDGVTQGMVAAAMEVRGYSMASDILRYAIMDRFGGVYTDVDIAPGRIALPSQGYSLSGADGDVPYIGGFSRDRQALEEFVDRRSRGRDPLPWGTVTELLADPDGLAETYRQLRKDPSNNNFIVAPPGMKFFRDLRALMPSPGEIRTRGADDPGDTAFVLTGPTKIWQLLGTYGNVDLATYDMAFVENFTGIGWMTAESDALLPTGSSAQQPAASASGFARWFTGAVATPVPGRADDDGRTIPVDPELVRRDLDWLPMVNPSRHEGGAGLTNCVLVATVVDDILRTGTVQIVPPTEVSPAEHLVNYTAGPVLAVPSRADLTDAVRRAGPGTRGIVVISEPGRDISHAFNVVNLDGEVLYLDGQSGDLAVWPEPSEAYFLPTAMAPSAADDWEPADLSRFEAGGQSVTGSFEELFLLPEVNKVLTGAKLSPAGLDEVRAAVDALPPRGRDNHRVFSWPVAHEIALRRDPGTEPPFPARPGLRGGGGGIEIEILSVVKPAEDREYPPRLSGETLFHDRTNGIKAVTDIAPLLVGDRGFYVYKDTARAAGVTGAPQARHIVELVTDKFSVLPGESGIDPAIGLRALRRYAEMLEGSADDRPLRRVLRGSPATVPAGAASAVVAGPSDPDYEPGGGPYWTHMSVGVPVQGLIDVIEYAQRLSAPDSERGDAPLRHSHDALRFGAWVAADYLGRMRQLPTTLPWTAGAAFRAHSPLIRSLIGTTALAYMQWAAVVHLVDGVNVKNNTLLILRNHMGTLHNALPHDLRIHLRSQAERLARTAYDSIARRTGRTLTFEQTVEQPLSLRSPLTIRDWFFAFLDPARVTQDQHGRTLRVSPSEIGVTTTFDNLDDDPGGDPSRGGLPLQNSLVVVEFRSFAPGFLDFTQIEQTWQQIGEMARLADRDTIGRNRAAHETRHVQFDRDMVRGLDSFNSSDDVAEGVARLVRYLPPSLPLPAYGSESGFQVNAVGDVLHATGRWLERGDDPRTVAARGRDLREAIGRLQELAAPPGASPRTLDAVRILTTTAARLKDVLIRREREALARPVPAPGPVYATYRPPRFAGGGTAMFAVEAPSDATADQVADTYDWLTGVNPFREQDEQDGAFSLNCVITAIATDLSLAEGAGHQASGVDVPVGPADPRGLPESDLANYQAQRLGLPDGDSRVYRFDSLEALRDVMRDAPRGSRGFVLIRATGSDTSHVFNVVRDEHGVSFLDGQRGGPARRPESIAEITFLPLTDGITVPAEHPLVTLAPDRRAGALWESDPRPRFAKANRSRWQNALTPSDRDGVRALVEAVERLGSGGPARPAALTAVDALRALNVLRDHHGAARRGEHLLAEMHRRFRRDRRADPALVRRMMLHHRTELPGTDQQVLAFAAVATGLALAHGSALPAARLDPEKSTLTVAFAAPGATRPALDAEEHVVPVSVVPADRWTHPLTDAAVLVDGVLEIRADASDRSLVIGLAGLFAEIAVAGPDGLRGTLRPENKEALHAQRTVVRRLFFAGSVFGTTRPGRWLKKQFSMPHTTEVLRAELRAIDEQLSVRDPGHADIRVWGVDLPAQFSGKASLADHLTRRLVAASSVATTFAGGLSNDPPRAMALMGASVAGTGTQSVVQAVTDGMAANHGALARAAVLSDPVRWGERDRPARTALGLPTAQLTKRMPAALALAGMSGLVTGLAGLDVPTVMDGQGHVLAEGHKVHRWDLAGMSTALQGGQSMLIGAGADWIFDLWEGRAKGAFERDLKSSPDHRRNQFVEIAFHHAREMYLRWAESVAAGTGLPERLHDDATRLIGQVQQLRAALDAEVDDKVAALKRRRRLFRRFGAMFGRQQGRVSYDLVDRGLPNGMPRIWHNMIRTGLQYSGAQVPSQIIGHLAGSAAGLTDAGVIAGLGRGLAYGAGWSALKDHEFRDAMAVAAWDARYRLDVVALMLTAIRDGVPIEPDAVPRVAGTARHPWVARVSQATALAFDQRRMNQAVGRPTEISKRTQTAYKHLPATGAGALGYGIGAAAGLIAAPVALPLILTAAGVLMVTGAGETYLRTHEPRHRQLERFASAAAEVAGVPRSSELFLEVIEENLSGAADAGRLIQPIDLPPHPGVHRRFGNWIQDGFTDVAVGGRRYARRAAVWTGDRFRSGQPPQNLTRQQLRSAGPVRLTAADRAEVDTLQQILTDLDRMPPWTGGDPADRSLLRTELARQLDRMGLWPHGTDWAWSPDRWSAIAAALRSRHDRPDPLTGTGEPRSESVTAMAAMVAIREDDQAPHRDALVADRLTTDHLWEGISMMPAVVGGRPRPWASVVPPGRVRIAAGSLKDAVLDVTVDDTLNRDAEVVIRPGHWSLPRYELVVRDRSTLDDPVALGNLLAEAVDVVRVRRPGLAGRARSVARDVVRAAGRYRVLRVPLSPPGHDTPPAATTSTATGSYAEHFILGETNRVLTDAGLPRATLNEVEEALAALPDRGRDNHRIVAWRVAHKIAEIRDPGNPPPFPDRPRLRAGGAGVEIEIPVFVSRAHQQPFPDGVSGELLFDDRQRGVLAKTEIMPVWLPRVPGAEPRFYTSREAAVQDGHEDAYRRGVHTLELVTGKVSVLRGESGVDPRVALDGLRHYTQLFERQTKETRLTPALDRSVLQYEGSDRAVFFGPSDPGRVPGSGRYWTHISAGVPLQGLPDAIRLAQSLAGSTPDGGMPLEHSGDAMIFAYQVAADYLAVVHRITTGLPREAAVAFMEHSADIRQMVGALAISYMQWAPLIHRPGPLNMKNNTLLILRHRADALNYPLPSAVRHFLARNSAQLMRRAVDAIRKRARLEHNVDHILSSRVPSGPTIGHMMQAFLAPASVPEEVLNRLDPRLLMAVSTTFPALDHGLAVVEFRNLGAGFLSMEDLAGTWSEIEGLARTTHVEALTRNAGQTDSRFRDRETVLSRALSLFSSSRPAARDVRDLLVRAPLLISEGPDPAASVPSRNLASSLLSATDAWILDLGSVAAIDDLDRVVATLKDRVPPLPSHAPAAAIEHREQWHTLAAGIRRNLADERRRLAPAPAGRRWAGQAPGGLVTEMPSDSTPEQIADDHSWLGDVNPFHDQDEQEGSFRLNCVITAIATDLSLAEGTGHQAGGVDVPIGPADPRGLPLTDLTNYQAQQLGLPEGQSRVHRFDTLESIRDAMRETPHGSRGLVITRGAGDATYHVVNVIRDRRGVTFLDGQRGGLALRPDVLAEILFLPLTEGISVQADHPLVTIADDRRAGGTSHSSDPVMPTDGQGQKAYVRRPALFPISRIAPPASPRLAVEHARDALHLYQQHLAGADGASDRIEALRDKWRLRASVDDAELTHLVEAWAEAESTAVHLDQSEFLRHTTEILTVVRGMGRNTAERHFWLIEAVLQEQYAYRWHTLPFRDDQNEPVSLVLRGELRAPDDLDALVQAATALPAPLLRQGKHPANAHILLAHMSGEAPIHAASMLLEDPPIDLVIEHDLTYFLDERRDMERVEPLPRKEAATLIAAARQNADRLMADVVAMGVPAQRITIEHTFDSLSTGWKRQVSDSHQEVARRFGESEQGAQATLRAALLREQPRAAELATALWAKLGLTPHERRKVVLLWVRRSGFNRRDGLPELDMYDGMLHQLIELTETRLDAKAVLIGDDPGPAFVGRRDGSLLRFWSDLVPGPTLNRAEQMYVLDLLNRHHDTVAIGKESGAIELPALLGMKTVYLEQRTMRLAKARRWMMVSGASIGDTADGDAQDRPGPVSTWRRQQFEAPTEWLFFVERIERLLASGGPELVDRTRHALNQWISTLAANDETRTASAEGTTDWISAGHDLSRHLGSLVHLGDGSLIPPVQQLIKHLTGDEQIPDKTWTYGIITSIKLSQGELHRLERQVAGLRSTPLDPPGRLTLADMTKDFTEGVQNPPIQQWLPRQQPIIAEPNLSVAVAAIDQRIAPLADGDQAPKSKADRQGRLDAIRHWTGTLDALGRLAARDRDSTPFVHASIDRLRTELRNLDTALVNALVDRAAELAAVDESSGARYRTLRQQYQSLLAARTDYLQRSPFRDVSALDAVLQAESRGFLPAMPQVPAPARPAMDVAALAHALDLDLLVRTGGSTPEPTNPGRPPMHVDARPGTPVPAGLALLGADSHPDDLRAAQTFPARPDQYVVFGHSSGGRLIVDGQEFTSEDLADLLAGEPAARDRTIVVMVCEAASGAGDAYAARLARALPAGARVIAAAGTAWTTADGLAFVTEPAFDETGRPVLRPASAAFGWKAFTATSTEDLGSDLPAATPRSGGPDAAATPWGSSAHPYPVHPVIHVAPEVYRRQVELYERNLAEHLARQPRVLYAAREATAAAGRHLPADAEVADLMAAFREVAGLGDVERLGSAGTSAELIATFDRLTVPGVARTDFVLAVVATGRGLREILIGAESVAAGPPVSRMDSDDDMYEALTAFGLTRTEIQSFSAFSDGLDPELGDAFRNIQTPGMLPHQAAYALTALGGLRDHGPYFTGITRKLLEEAAKKHNELRDEAPDAQSWFGRTPGTREAVQRGLTFAHLVALQVYTAEQHRMINLMAPRSALMTMATTESLRSQVVEQTAAAAKEIRNGRSTGLPLELIIDREIERLVTGLKAAHRRRADSEFTALSAELARHAETLSTALPRQLTAHFDMVVEAMQLLPPVSAEVFRGDWAAPVWSKYRGRQFTLDSLASTSRIRQVAEQFADQTEFPATRTLISATLTGHGGRDISYPSLVEREDEVLLLPGATFAVVGHDRATRGLAPVVTEQHVDGIAARTAERVGDRFAAVAATLSETVSAAVAEVAELHRHLDTLTDAGDALRLLGGGQRTGEQILAAREAVSAALADASDLLRDAREPQGSSMAQLHDREARLEQTVSAALRAQDEARRAWTTLRPPGDAAPAGMVWGDPETRRHAGTFPHRTGAYVFFAHGVDGTPTTDGRAMTVEKMAELVTADPAARGRTIVLPICDTGADAAGGFAARLARELPGRTVVAPAGTVWTTVDGQAFVGRTEMGADGRPRLHPADPGHGWRAFHTGPAASPVTSVTELGTDLPGATPRHGDGAGAYAWGSGTRPYPTAPIIELNPKLYHGLAAGLERNLGAWLFQQPHVGHAARAAVARLREVLTARSAGGTTDPLRAFVQDDRTSAGQVGTGLDTAAIAEMLETGNLREVMTAFYNASYFNRSTPAPTLKTVVHDLLSQGDLTQADRLGLDREALGMVMAEYGSWSRALMKRLADVPGQGHTFDTDPFALGVLAAHSDRTASNLATFLSQHGKSMRPGADSAERRHGLPGKLTAAELTRLGIGLSPRERAYLSADPVPFGTSADGQVAAESWITDPIAEHGPELPLPWVTGQAYWDLDQDSWWYQATKVAAGMPVIAGVSGTTARMLAAFDWLRVPGVSRSDFLLAVMAWMLTSQDHSLYEILRGAEIMNAGPRVSTMDSADQMYQGLTALGISRSQIGRLSPLDETAHPGLDGIHEPGMLPHQAAYALTALGSLSEHGLYFTGMSADMVTKAAKLHRELRGGGPAAAEWLAGNEGAAGAVARRLTFAHVLALQMYTSDNHAKINIMAPRTWIPRTMADRNIRNWVTDEIITAAAAIRADEKIVLPYTLSRDRETVNLLLALQTAVGRHDVAGVRAVSSQLDDLAVALGEDLPTQLAAHFDMVVEALSMLPPVTATAFRGDWSIPLLTRYRRRSFSAAELTSTSRSHARAKVFTRGHDFPVLMEATLTGHAGRDISVLSRHPNEQEILLLPGATFRVDHLRPDRRTLMPLTTETSPAGPAAAAARVNAERYATAAGGLADTASSVLPGIGRLRTSAADMAAEVQNLTQDAIGAWTDAMDLTEDLRQTTAAVRRSSENLGEARQRIDPADAGDLNGRADGLERRFQALLPQADATDRAIHDLNVAVTGLRLNTAEDSRDALDTAVARAGQAEAEARSAAAKVAVLTEPARTGREPLSGRSMAWLDRLETDLENAAGTTLARGDQARREYATLTTLLHEARRDRAEVGTMLGELHDLEQWWHRHADEVDRLKTDVAALRNAVRLIRRNTRR